MDIFTTLNEAQIYQLSLLIFQITESLNQIDTRECWDNVQDIVAVWETQNSIKFIRF